MKVINKRKFKRPCSVSELVLTRVFSSSAYIYDIKGMNYCPFHLIYVIMHITI